jgi:hypothetical protein
MRAPAKIVTAAIACAALPVSAALAGVPATNFDPENHSQNIYFAGTDGSLREVSWTPSGGWDRVSVVVAAGSVGSAPATNFDPENHSQNIYFAGTDGSLREISWTPPAGWDGVSIITPAGALGPPASGSAPATPTGSGSVALTPAPPRHHRRRLDVKIVISWRWNHRHTRLVRIRIGRAPHGAVFSISCRGGGCPSHRMYATSATLRRHHRTLRGSRYRAGDRLLLTLSAPAWGSERARIVIRDGRAPTVQLL